MMETSMTESDRDLRRCARRLLADERGQDLIEYALVAGLIGVVGVAAWNAIGGGIGTAYTGWDTSVQHVWEAPDPSGS